MDPLNQVDLFGTALFRLLESNRRIRTLTTIGAPIQAIARGLMFNKTLVSLYLIKSRGSYEDMQAMGDSVAHHRSLLVLWMGGSDESLLCPMVSVDTRDSVGGGIGGGQGQDGTGGQGGGGGGADGKDGHPSHRFGRFWHGDSLQDVDGLQNSTTRSGRWLDGRSSTAHRRRNRRKGVHSISFAGILPKSFRLATATRSTDYHQEMTFHPTTNHYNTVRKNPYMWSTGPNSAGGGGGGGGMAQSVIPRNPLVDGIRRNHRLIKIRIDPMPTTTPFSSSPLMSREAGGYGGSTGPFPATLPMQRKSTTQSVTFSHYNTVTTRSTTQASARGVGGGGLSTALRATLSPPALPKPMVLNVATTAPTADSAPTQASAQAPAQAPTTTALSSPPQPTSRHAHPPPPGQLRRSSVSYQSLAAVQDQAQQQERMVQQQLAKKMAANRAALRDHSRIGAEELRMLRIDEDIIREVCKRVGRPPVLPPASGRLRLAATAEAWACAAAKAVDVDEDDVGRLESECANWDRLSDPAVLVIAVAEEEEEARLPWREAGIVAEAEEEEEEDPAPSPAAAPPATPAPAKLAD
ncbi:hypothetical protein BGZ73_005763 [Actinomortierella ambigua]|nr:hypothetical protein BGZ73_005763 [Actinomortierella ambigua]